MEDSIRVFDYWSKQMSDTAKLIYGDKQIDLAVSIGTEDERGVDISQLRAQTGLITMDDGYMNTGSCLSKITFIDGEKGILRYRGYPIEQLAEKSTFLEVAYLLIYGELPDREQYEAFRKNITRHTMIHEDLKRLYDGFPKDSHPMAILSSMICTL